MGDKEFHQMLVGTLCDYDNKIYECAKGDRKESLKILSTNMGGDLTEKDEEDLVNAFDSILKIKTKNGYIMRSPRN